MWSLTLGVIGMAIADVAASSSGQTLGCLQAAERQPPRSLPRWVTPVACSSSARDWDFAATSYLQCSGAREESRLGGFRTQSLSRGEEGVGVWSGWGCAFMGCCCLSKQHLALA